jgi:hypothetical protein
VLVALEDCASDGAPVGGEVAALAGPGQCWFPSGMTKPRSRPGENDAGFGLCGLACFWARPAEPMITRGFGGASRRHAKDALLVVFAELGDQFV